MESLGQMFLGRSTEEDHLGPMTRHQPVGDGCVALWVPGARFFRCPDVDSDTKTVGLPPRISAFESVVVSVLIAFLQ